MPNHNRHLALLPYIHCVAHVSPVSDKFPELIGTISAQYTILAKPLSNACYAVQCGHASERHTGKDIWLLANLSFHSLIQLPVTSHRIMHFLFSFLGFWTVRGFSTALLLISIYQQACFLKTSLYRDSPYGLIEDALQVTLGQRRAFQIFMRADVPRHIQCSLIRHRLHFFGSERF